MKGWAGSVVHPDRWGWFVLVASPIDGAGLVARLIGLV